MFLGLVPHYEAIQTILAAVQMGEGVIKVTGEVGTGKTMVCRKLIEQIDAKVKEVKAWQKQRDKMSKKYERELLKLGERYLKLKEKQNE